MLHILDARVAHIDVECVNLVELDGIQLGGNRLVVAVIGDGHGIGAVSLSAEGLVAAVQRMPCAIRAINLVSEGGTSVSVEFT